MRKFFVLGAVVALAFAASAARAESIATLETDGNGANAGSISGVVTAVIYGGTSSTNPSILVDDGTGGCEVYTTAAGTHVYVGDDVTVSFGAGQYSLYNGSAAAGWGVPEISTATSTTVTSHNNYIPAPIAITVAQATAASNPGVGVPNPYAGRLVEISGASFGGFVGSGGTGTLGATFPSTTTGIGNNTGTVSDSTGSEPLYYWESSYKNLLNSSSGAYPPANGSLMTGLAGDNTTATNVDLVGFVSAYGSGAEFIPFFETTTPGYPVPEPMTFIPALAGLGLGFVAVIRRKLAK